MSTEADLKKYEAMMGEAREEYPPGPWMAEPDRVLFRWKGFPCLIVRNPGSGNLCGYVGLPPSHPYHGKGREDELPLSVHGGLTYGRACQGAICHVPRPGEPEESWWLGFDCGHAGDVSPSMLKYGNIPGDEYRDLKYVRAEVRRLAAQLAKVGA